MNPSYNIRDKTWVELVAYASYFVEEATDDINLEDVMPSWRDKEVSKFGEELTSARKANLKQFFNTYVYSVC